MENDLIWFLSEEFQFQLKQEAQCESGDRFEKVLSKYCELFLKELKNLKSSHDINLLEDFPSEDKNKLYEWADLAYDEIRRNINTYEKLFEALLYTYKLFLKGKHFQATLHLFDILEEYEIADAIDPKELGLFYKGRIFKDEEDISSEKFYYHIPYDKRYLISNQRFSVSGQPILYLGSSILDVLYELRCDVNSCQEVAIASFSFNSISDETNKNNHDSIKIYDISNQIMKFFYGKLASLNYHGYDSTENYKELGFDIDKHFKKFILMQLCTFKINENRKFVEEYVLGQLLTEALRINNYDGIQFPSTQFENKKLRFPMFSYSAAKENLAIFTTYSESEKYDYNLIERFSIQPLNELSANKTVEEYKQQISKLSHNITVRSLIACDGDIYNQFENALYSLQKIFISEYGLKVGDEDYYSLPFAKMELKAQVDYLKYIERHLCQFERKKLQIDQE